MPRRAVLTAALLAASAFVTPAVADDPTPFGIDCGAYPNQELARSRPSSVVLAGGPWTTLDAAGFGEPDGLADAQITIHCVLQTSPTAGSPSSHSDGFRSVHGSGTGVAVAVGGVFPLPPTGLVFLCTYVEIWHNGHYHAFADDADENPSNGIQCGYIAS